MKKILSGILAAAMVMSFASVAAMAAPLTSGNDKAVTGKISTVVFYDDDDEKYADTEVKLGTDGSILAEDRIAPNSIIYAYIKDVNWDTTGAIAGNHSATIKSIQDKDLFKIDIDKDTNGKMIKKISYDGDKKIPGGDRALRLKIELADTTTTSEIHTDGTISFIAKKDSTDKIGGTETFVKGDKIVIPYSFWINNEKKTNDDNPDAGDRVYFDPDKNDTNTLIWGDDRAALKFEADDDASKFYARLSTSTDRTLYAEYGDPVDADLWFYDFVTNPTIPSTSRATLTLGIPWDEDDDDYVPDPETCFIYEKDADGNLTDVTDKFTFSEDDEEIPGWSMKTRVLGTYVLSDTELDIEAINADDEDDDDAAADVTTPDGGKDIPQTGSSDMVNVAVVAAVVSLAAAGAVAFRKVK
ncbi:hypothetical protein DWV16_14430 [Anaerotruncus sp. AF02-27]|uniref:hypothetical protein n=1 Tax=Anaerotruncus sp. AF02-27 TaxID=2292191 RepID=UPI000E482624|nr:hypothetical protein [Anaerotruncus sp. AF02-27]RGX54367.1 hypothetical protein DWV16_14430 [Anaerotruncus sp. AF02-27]